MATPAERSVPLPPVGFGLALDPGVRWVGDGRVLLGGSPLRLLKLTEGGAAVVRGFAAGERIGRSAARRRLARRLLEAGMAHPQPPRSSSGFTWHDVTIVVPVYGANAQVLPTLKSLAEAAVGA